MPLESSAVGLIQLFFLLRGATPSLRLVLAVADAPSAGPHSPVRPPARKAVLCTYLSRGLPKSRGVSPDSRLGISGDLLGDFHSCWEHPKSRPCPGSGIRSTLHPVPNLAGITSTGSSPICSGASFLLLSGPHRLFYLKACLDQSFHESKLLCIGPSNHRPI